ncbi:MAG: protein kinase [Steroidobacteraceae bacterium]|nr:protein kinase [Steroidobacteraceae bacterium]MCC7198814.1 protein kinase [Gammaproteobacteria bacterium]
MNQTVPTTPPRGASGGPPPPERIGKYDVIREVGRGSSSIVYLSHDPYYGRDVAIKLYRIDSGEDDAKAGVHRKMFLSEAHMVGMLQHPNVMPIYDAGEVDGLLYVVTEFVHGARTLAAYTRPDNLLPIDDVIGMMFKVAKALHYAHSRGVIHRDVKPSNIMLTTDSDVRIIDFGIALVTGSDLVRIEGIAGSPSYMSPEQVQSLEITGRSDLYALGAVLYELLTGFRPYRAGTLTKLLQQIVYADPTPVSKLRPEIPVELDEVVRKAMEKDPEKRFKNGNEFAAAVARVHSQLRQQVERVDRQERFALLRRLKFFHEFSSAEIWEVLRAGTWHDYGPGEEIVKEGVIDDRFYVIVSGQCWVERNGRKIGEIETGGCFGEMSFVSGAKRQATIVADGDVEMLQVSSTLLEQASPASQLRFLKVFLRRLITRLQGGDQPATDAIAPAQIGSTTAAGSVITQPLSD